MRIRCGSLLCALALVAGCTPPEDKDLAASGAPAVAGPEEAEFTRAPAPPPPEEAAPPAPAPPPVEEEAAAPVPQAPRPAPPAPPTEINDETIARYLLAVAATDPPHARGLSDDAFLDLVEKRAFGYFWWETNPTNGLTRDRGRNFESSESLKHASIAAVGFALSACAIGAERGWVSREAALARVRRTLRTFDEGPVRNMRGFFPHFVDMFTGADSPGTEVSTIDTALLLAGMIVAMEYFNDPEVSMRARRIFERADWRWARNGHPDFVTHGLDADGRFFGVHWSSFNEGLLVYLLAPGSPAHSLPASSWYAVGRNVGMYEGFEFLTEYGFQSIFRWQYPALYYDFRGRRDAKGIDYFHQTSLAVLAMREYCLRQAEHFPFSYGRDLWGLGAADGPGNRYMIYGFPPGEPYSPTDGTVVPYAIAGSLPFAPRHGIRALRHLYDNHRNAWGKYGFADSLNPTLGFVAQDALGLDAGASLMGIENYRSGFFWHFFMQSPWIRKATREIGWKREPHPSDPAGPIDLAAVTWRFQPGDGAFADPDYDDSSWTEAVLPDRWENMDPALADLDGVAWYRVGFTLDAKRAAQWTKSGRPLVLVMGAVDDADVSYVNGEEVGSTQSGPDIYRVTRRYELPPDLLHPGRNVVAVRVTDGGSYGGIWLPPLTIGPKGL